jgi:hypothetical protein
MNIASIAALNIGMFEVLVRFPVTTSFLEGEDGDRPTRESFADHIFNQVLYDGVEGIEHRIEDIFYIDDASEEMVEQLFAPVDLHQQRLRMAQAILEAYNQLIYRDQSDVDVPLEKQVPNLLADILLWCAEYGVNPNEIPCNQR